MIVNEAVEKELARVVAKEIKQKTTEISRVHSENSGSSPELSSTLPKAYNNVPGAPESLVSGHTGAGPARNMRARTVRADSARQTSRSISDVFLLFSV